jgi:hypothetical protein
VKWHPIVVFPPLILGLFVLLVIALDVYDLHLAVTEGTWEAVGVGIFLFGLGIYGLID